MSVGTSHECGCRLYLYFTDAVYHVPPYMSLQVRGILDSFFDKEIVLPFMYNVSLATSFDVYKSSIFYHLASYFQQIQASGIALTQIQNGDCSTTLFNCSMQPGTLPMFLPPKYAAHN